jgi:hypothetical protein
MTSPYDTGRFAEVSDLDLAKVHSHTDVARIVEQMHNDLRAHPDAWENPTLDRFLDRPGRQPGRPRTAAHQPRRDPASAADLATARRGPRHGNRLRIDTGPQAANET